MNNHPPQGLFSMKCPACGSPMSIKATHQGGTASQWEIWPVSSTGSAMQYIYPKQEIYECTNPSCHKTLLRPE